MKTVYKLLSVLLICLLLTACANKTEDTNNVEKISGAYFGTSAKAIKTEADVDSSLELEELSFDSEKVRLVAKAAYPGGSTDIDITGTLYNSVTTEGTYVVLFDEADGYSLLSFVIEAKPNIKPNILLFQEMTKHTLENLPEEQKNEPVVLRAALKLKNGDVVYYEDVLETIVVTDELSNALTAVDSDTQDKVYRNDRWFMSF